MRYRNAYPTGDSDFTFDVNIVMSVFGVSLFIKFALSLENLV